MRRREGREGPKQQLRHGPHSRARSRVARAVACFHPGCGPLTMLPGADVCRTNDFFLVTPIISQLGAALSFQLPAPGFQPPSSQLPVASCRVRPFGAGSWELEAGSRELGTVRKKASAPEGTEARGEPAKRVLRATTTTGRDASAERAETEHCHRSGFRHLKVEVTSGRARSGAIDRGANGQPRSRTRSGRRARRRRDDLVRRSMEGLIVRGTTLPARGTWPAAKRRTRTPP